MSPLLSSWTFWLLCYSDFPFQQWANPYYDHNNNVIRREVENRDSNNQELVGDFIAQEFTYDILDQLIEERQEVSTSPDVTITTKYRNDRNGNRVLVISPVANLSTGDPDHQPSNIVSSVFDERDLVFTSTRGGLTDQFRALQAHADIPERAGVPNSPDISTSTQRYDGNQNLVESIDAVNSGGDGKPENTLSLYDGFDRQISSIDAVGTQQFVQYDPLGNVIRSSIFGPVGGPSPQDNHAATFQQPLGIQDFHQPLLSQSEHSYDELSREFERNERLFVYAGVTFQRTPVLKDGPLGQSNDGRVTTRFEFDRKSRPTFIIQDNLSTWSTSYDGMDRVVQKGDPEANERHHTYDDNGNITTVTEVEVTAPERVQTGAVPNLREVFTTIYVFDSLNRPIRTTDTLGQTRRYHFDSRNNLIFTSDAQYSREAADLIQDPLGLFPVSGQGTQGVTGINRPGNTMDYFYDGLNRKIAEVHHLRGDGQGKNAIETSNPSNPDGLVVIDYAWDANSRLVAMADDGSAPGDQNTSIGTIEPSNPLGNVTRYRYDDLSRHRQTIFDDGTLLDYTYDANDNIIRVIDQNGSIMTNTYDGVNRVVHRDIKRATSQDPHPLGGFKDPHVNWQVIGTTVQAFEYDGLSRKTRTFDNGTPEDPADDNTVTYAYDSLSRLLEEVQNGQAISSSWEGVNNRVGLVYPNGRILELSFDQLQHITAIKDQGAAKTIVNYDYIGPMRVLERLYQNGTRLTFLDDGRVQDVGYDGLGRMILDRHVRQDTGLVASFAYEYDLVNHKVSEVRQHEQNHREDYSYDSLYRLTLFLSQGEHTDSWQLDGVGNWTSRQGVVNNVNNVNEYSSFAGVLQLYDANGNLVEDDIHHYQYDIFNRLRQVIRKADNTVIAAYHYDGSHRRTERAVTQTQGFDDHVRYFYDGQREIEEQRPDSRQQYVYGSWIDEPLTLDKDTNNDGLIDTTLFYHGDARTNTVALTDITGSVVERSTYDAYGQPTVFDAHGAPQKTSAVGNPYLFAGRRYDPETGWYYFRARYLNPHTGRFIMRDPIGIWGDIRNLGNGYTYVQNNPINWLDPLGMDVNDCPDIVATGTCVITGEPPSDTPIIGGIVTVGCVGGVCGNPGGGPPAPGPGPGGGRGGADGRDDSEAQKRQCLEKSQRDYETGLAICKTIFYAGSAAVGIGLAICLLVEGWTGAGALVCLKAADIAEAVIAAAAVACKHSEDLKKKDRDDDCRREPVAIVLPVSFIGNQPKEQVTTIQSFNEMVSVFSSDIKHPNMRTF